jgi:quercetin dioxygenase-like cupin family protein
MRLAESIVSHSFPIARLDLEAELHQMRASPRAHGHLGKTVVRNGDLSIVLMIIARGEWVPEAHARGSLVIQALDGRVLVTIRDGLFELRPGQFLAIERDVPYEVFAPEDSAVMMTLTH